MNPATEEALAAATAKLDEQPQPEAEPKTPEQPEVPSEEPAKEKEPSEDKGYTAEDVDDSEDVDELPAKETPINTDGMSPEQKYIVDNLPYIVARVKQGDTVKEVQVKSWTQLPDNLEFASKRDEMAFINALHAQENRALALQAKFQQDQQVQQSKQFEQQEDAMIRSDVAELQRDGDLPKFKYKMSDANFDKDPATKQVQDIMDFMEERNKQYLAEYQQGRPFRHIGFREAFYEYQRKHPVKTAAEDREDTERKNVARNINNTNRGMPTRELRKSTIRSGTTTQDLLNRIDAENW